ncbi:MAG: TetR family transcriptional regulator C-terminal domain-containing protein [Alphaproteobacteria bacterium]|nr:TetR family transcriptional regulator C-terminal domain-containing protein [Alphaproteobacteria bacterium]
MAEMQPKKPPGRPRGEQTENADRRRRQLVEAAISSIVHLGMSATTLATVSESAGLSQGVAVFYFKSKENLLIETLRHHYHEYDEHWHKALAEAPDDPLEKLIALVFADVDPKICNTRNLTLWNSYWGEAVARPKFAEICESYDRARYDTLIGFCEQASPLMVGVQWTPIAVADVLDTMTDGMWTRMHVTPSFMDLQAGRMLLARFLSTVYPSQADLILQRANRLNALDESIPQ